MKANAIIVELSKGYKGKLVIEMFFSLPVLITCPSPNIVSVLKLTLQTFHIIPETPQMPNSYAAITGLTCFHLSLMMAMKFTFL